jgi:hypothetical protein
LSWQAQVGAAPITLHGDVAVRLYAAMKDFSAGKVGQITVYVRAQSSAGTWVTLGSIAAPNPAQTWTVPDFIEVSFNVSIGATPVTVDAGRHIEVSMTVSNSAGDDMLIAYSTTTHPALATFPTVS